MSKKLLREIETQSRMATLERNPLQRAYDSFHEMERERDMAQQEVAELITTNNALVSEINMLREALDRSEVNRIRFQGISSTLLGRLLAINDCIAGAVRASIREKFDPIVSLNDETEADLQADVANDPLGGFTDADREAVERFAPKPGPKIPTEPKATPVPPMAIGTAVGVPAVDWSAQGQQ